LRLRRGEPWGVPANAGDGRQVTGSVQPEASEHQLEAAGAPAAQLSGRRGCGHCHTHNPDRELPFVRRFKGSPHTAGNAGEPLAQARQGGLNPAPEGEDLLQVRALPT